MGGLIASLSVGCVGPAFGEDELAMKYGNGKMIDTSLVDQACLKDKCALQSKECLVDDPSCRKGLTCTAKCMGDNACITGCMARWGNSRLDNLLKCTIEENECIKVAILPGGGDAPGRELPSPIPTVSNFDKKQLEGKWYKVLGFNKNYDCYACQRNTFTRDTDNKDKLLMDVEFSMPRLLEDGSPPPPSNKAEQVFVSEDGTMLGSKSIALNDYHTNEVMTFDSPHELDLTEPSAVLSLGGKKGTMRYARTAHSEGEMFGLKFNENWYVIGSNDPEDQDEFKVIYYNGKTRQNTYSGAFVYARQRELPEAAMAKVYKIAADAGLNPDQFCKIRNGCFSESDDNVVPSPKQPLRGILASTKVSELLGVKPVFGEGYINRVESEIEREEEIVVESARKWYHKVGDYLENPHRHFKLIDELRETMDWPEEIRSEVISRR